MMLFWEIILQWSANMDGVYKLGNSTFNRKMSSKKEFLDSFKPTNISMFSPGVQHSSNKSSSVLLPIKSDRQCAFVMIVNNESLSLGAY